MQITREERDAFTAMQTAQITAHCEKMQRKKADRALPQQSGFTPTPQHRLDAKLSIATQMNMAQGMNQGDAYRAAARDLLPVSHCKPFEKSLINTHRRMRKQQLARLKREEARLREKEAA